MGANYGRTMLPVVVCHLLLPLLPLTVAIPLLFGDGDLDFETDTQTEATGEARKCK